MIFANTAGLSAVLVGPVTLDQLQDTHSSTCVNTAMKD